MSKRRKTKRRRKRRSNIVQGRMRTGDMRRKTKTLRKGRKKGGPKMRSIDVEGDDE